MSESEAYEVLKSKETMDVLKIYTICRRILQERFGGIPNHDELWLKHHGDKLSAVSSVRSRLRVDLATALKILSWPIDGE